MSRLPRKHSRTITIDGRDFRWLLHGRNRYLGRAPAVVTISIQEELQHPGMTLQCMAVSVQNEEAEEECGYCNTSITPADIEKIIRAGLARGWDPTKGTGTFHPGNMTLGQYKVTRQGLHESDS